LSHRALPVIIEYDHRFEPDPALPAGELTALEHWIKMKSQSFMQFYERSSWPSWNYADDRIYRYLKTQPQLQ
ncbi:MAG: hypothetical protein WBB36_08270, partial [Chitinophagales bacterium]